MGENNIGGFQGSAISALLFIIYLDDMMEDLEALNRRTNLPIRIVRDRPQQLKEELLWEEIQEGDEEPSIQEETKEMHILKNYTHTDTEMGAIKINKKKSNNGVKRLRKRLKQKYYQEPTNKEVGGETSNESTDENENIDEQDNIDETEDSNRQRKEQANRQLWKKLGTRIVTGEETHQRTRKEMENQTIKYTKQDTEKETKRSHQDQQTVQNAIVFADDTKLLSENDTHEQMNERMGNYDIITETRHLKIQRGKVLLLRRDKEKHRKELPPPFGKIKHQNSGTILGKI